MDFSSLSDEELQRIVSSGGEYDPNAGVPETAPAEVPTENQMEVDFSSLSDDELQRIVESDGSWESLSSPRPLRMGEVVASAGERMSPDDFKGAEAMGGATEGALRAQERYGTIANPDDGTLGNWAGNAFNTFAMGGTGRVAATDIDSKTRQVASGFMEGEGGKKIPFTELPDEDLDDYMNSVAPNGFFGYVGNAVGLGGRNNLMKEWDDTQGVKIQDPVAKKNARVKYAMDIARGILGIDAQLKGNAKAELEGRDKQWQSGLVAGGMEMAGYMSPYLASIVGGPWAGMAASAAAEGTARRNELIGPRYEEDGNGNIRYIGEGDSRKTALVKGAVRGAGSALIERFTGDVAGKLVGATLGKFPIVQKVGDAIVDSAVGKKLASYTKGFNKLFGSIGLNTLPVEVGEELVDQVFDAGLGLDRTEFEKQGSTAWGRTKQSIAQFIKPENLLDLVESMALVQILGGGAATYGQWRSSHNADALLERVAGVDKSKLKDFTAEEKWAAYDAYVNGLSEEEVKEKLGRGAKAVNALADTIRKDAAWLDDFRNSAMEMYGNDGERRRYAAENDRMAATEEAQRREAGEDFYQGSAIRRNIDRLNRADELRQQEPEKRAQNDEQERYNAAMTARELARTPSAEAQMLEHQERYPRISPSTQTQQETTDETRTNETLPPTEQGAVGTQPSEGQTPVTVPQGAQSAEADGVVNPPVEPVAETPIEASTSASSAEGVVEQPKATESAEGGSVASDREYVTSVANRTDYRSVMGEKFDNVEYRKEFSERLSSLTDSEVHELSEAYRAIEEANRSLDNAIAADDYDAMDKFDAELYNAKAVKQEIESRLKISDWRLDEAIENRKKITPEQATAERKKGKRIPKTAVKTEGTAPVVEKSGDEATISAPQSVEDKIAAMPRGSKEQLKAQHDYVTQEIAKAKAAIEGKFTPKTGKLTPEEKQTDAYDRVKDSGDIPETVNIKVPGDGEITVKNNPHGMEYLDKFAAKFKPQTSGLVSEMSIPKPPSVKVVDKSKVESAEKETKAFVSKDKKKTAYHKPYSGDDGYVYATTGRITVRRKLRKGEKVAPNQDKRISSLSHLLFEGKTASDYSLDTAETYPKIVQALTFAYKGWESKDMPAVDVLRSPDGKLQFRARDAKGNGYATDAWAKTSTYVTTWDGEQLRDVLKLAAKNGAKKIDVGLDKNGIAYLKFGDWEAVLSSVKVEDGLRKKWDTEDAAESAARPEASAPAVAPTTARGGGDIRERLAKAYEEYAEEPLPGWANSLSDEDAAEYLRRVDAVMNQSEDDNGKAFDALVAFEEKHEAAQKTESKQKTEQKVPNRIKPAAESAAVSEPAPASKLHPATEKKAVKGAKLKRAEAKTEPQSAFRTIGGDGRPTAETMAAIKRLKGAAFLPEKDLRLKLTQARQALRNSPNDARVAQAVNDFETVLAYNTEMASRPANPKYMREQRTGMPLSQGVPARWSAGARKRVKKAVRLVRNLVQAGGLRGMKVEFADRLSEDSSGSQLRNRQGAVVGAWDRAQNRLVLLPGANADTVAHEIGGHAVYQFAEQLAADGDRTLLDRLDEAIAAAPDSVWDEVNEKYPDATPDVLRDEVLAHIVGRKGSAAIEKALRTRAGRQWYQRIWQAIKDVLRGIASKMGFNRADLSEIDGLSGSETVDWLVRQMVEGKTLGTVKSDSSVLAAAVERAANSGKAEVVNVGGKKIVAVGERSFKKGDETAIGEFPGSNEVKISWYKRLFSAIYKRLLDDKEKEELLRLGNAVPQDPAPIVIKSTGSAIYFWSQSPKEFSGAKNSRWLEDNDKHAYRAKMSLIPHLKTILENAVLIKGDVLPDHAHTHHREYYKSFDYYSTEFAVRTDNGNVENYNGTVILNRHENGTLYFYDIKVEPKKQRATDESNRRQSSIRQSPLTPDKIPQVGDNVNRDNSDIRYSRSAAAPGTAIMDEERTFGERAKEKLYDSMAPVQELQDEIGGVQERVRGDGYTDHNTSTDLVAAKDKANGRIEFEMRDLQHRVDKVAKTLADAGISQKEFDLYLQCRHAAERNRVIAERNGDTYNADYSKGMGQITLPNGNRVGLSENVANDILNQEPYVSKRTAFENAAQGVYDILAADLERRKESGRLSQEEYDFYHDRVTSGEWEHYVPLKTDMERLEPGIFNSSTATVRRNEFMKARGRGEGDIADSPFAATVLQAQQGIKGAIRNEVANVEANLVQHAIDRGFVDANGNPLVAEIVPGDDLQNKGTRFEFTFGDGSSVVSDGAMKLAGNHPEIHLFKRDGKMYAIRYVKGAHGRGLEVAKAASGENLESWGEGILKAVPKATQWMSAMRTQYSPEFTISNWLADSLNAAQALVGRYGVWDGTKAFGKAFASEFKNAKNVWRYLREGTLTGDVKKAVEGGLLTKGGTASEGFEGTEKSIKNRIEEFRRAGQGFWKLKSNKDRAAWMFEHIRNYVSLANELMEYSTRIGLFSVLHNQGVPVSEAVKFARDATVNFNRKGTLMPIINGVYMFANASVQGAARAVQAGRESFEAAPNDGSGWGRNKVKGDLLLALAAIGVAQAVVDSLWGNDDEREEEGGRNARNRSEYDKKHNVGIPLPGGYNVPIMRFRGPYAAIPYLAQKVTEVVLGEADPSDAAWAVAREATDQAFDLVGGSGVFNDNNEVDFSLFGQSLAPSVIDPVIQFASGKDYKGDNRLRKSFDDTKPLSWNGKRSTAAPYQWVAKAGNWLTGGNSLRKGKLDVAPEDLQLLWETIFGGLGRDISNVGSTVANVAQLAVGGDPERLFSDIPIARRLVREYPESTSRYYEALEDYERDKAEFKGATADRRREMRKGKPYLFLGKSLLDGQIERIKELTHLERGEIKVGRKWVEPKTPRTEAQKQKFRELRLRLQAKVLKALGE